MSAMDWNGDNEVDVDELKDMILLGKTYGEIGDVEAA